MKRLDYRAILFVTLMLVSIGGSIAPVFAASHGPMHPVPGYVLDGEPTPTPTPILVQPDEICTAGC